MSEVSMKNDEVDIVIGAIQSDLTSFLEDWKPFISQFHLIIVQDPNLKEELKIPGGFNIDVYKKSDIERTVGSASVSSLLSGYSCRYFVYLISQKNYVISIDDDCTPAKDTKGNMVDVVAQHITNLKTPATPFFFNTLFNPFCKGADFVRGYPTLISGVPSALSCGLWLNLADYDAPTQALKPEQTNNRCIDAALTIPRKTLKPALLRALLSTVS